MKPLGQLTVILVKPIQCQKASYTIYITKDNERQKIKDVKIEILDEPQTVYNFEVEEWHTYFVSDLGIWVHNQCDYFVTGGSVAESLVMQIGYTWVGAGYTEIDSGVFRSSDGTRQFRITDSDFKGVGFNGVPHFHLESVKPDGKNFYENNHVAIEEEMRKNKKN